VRKIAESGIITTIAGNGTPGFSGDGGAAISAQLQYPIGIALDPSGNLYVADAGNNRVRKVSATGTISTLAGNGAAAFSGDGGAAIQASLNDPFGIAVDGSGSVLIADYKNSRVRKVSSGGVITTIAGNGQQFFSGAFTGDGGLATSAVVDALNVAVDGSGNVLITDSFNNRIRKVNADGVISTVAGSERAYGFLGDGGSATSATLYQPWSAAADAAGNLYIADSYELIRKVSIVGTITTVAGAGIVKYAGDGGAAKYAVFNAPAGLGMDASGNI
jgi:sugar lactone lactonase YvrE